MFVNFLRKISNHRSSIFHIIPIFCNGITTNKPYTWQRTYSSSSTNGLLCTSQDVLDVIERKLFSKWVSYHTPHSNSFIMCPFLLVTVIKIIELYFEVIFSKVVPSRKNKTLYESYMKDIDWLVEVNMVNTISIYQAIHGCNKVLNDVKYIYIPMFDKNH